MKTSTPPVLITFALVCFALSPTARAATPAPDGGYPGSNTAEGTDALFNRTSGISNTALGYQALYRDTVGSSNTAVGLDALYHNIFGNYNTANGAYALLNNGNGDTNTANGVNALRDNRTGSQNTAAGVSALISNTSGFNNTAIGAFALAGNDSGGSNVAVGSTALGHNTGGSNNIALGNHAGNNLTTGSNNIDIGNLGVAGESNTIRIGGTRLGSSPTATYIAGIVGVNVPPVEGSPVLIDGDGRLGVAASSKRFKDEIKPMDKASEAVLALKPVTFHYKPEIDPKGIPQFGLVAEEVEKINPDLVARDKEGKPYTVRYDAVNAMLLNEFLKEHKAFLKEHRKVQEQEATIAQLQKDFRATVAQLATRLDEQAAQIQKVSTQLEANKPTPQVVTNNR